VREKDFSKKKKRRRRRRRERTCGEEYQPG
jgi:hypothetical protein